VDPVSYPLLLRKSGSAGNRTRDLWICGQELLPLDHRGGHRIIPVVRNLTLDCQQEPTQLNSSIFYTSHSGMKLTSHTFHIKPHLMDSDDGVWHSELVGFWTLSIVRNLKKLENIVSEIGSVSVLRRKDLVQWLKLALSKGPNRVGVFLPTPEDGNRSTLRNVAF
jgi:hypothetical protein